MNFSKNGIKLYDTPQNDYVLNVKQLHFPANMIIPIEKQDPRLEDVYMTDPFNMEINLKRYKNELSNYIKFLIPFNYIPFCLDAILFEINLNTYHSSKMVDINRIDYSKTCIRIVEQLYIMDEINCLQLYLNNNQEVEIGVHIYTDSLFNKIVDTVTIKHPFSISFIGGYIAGY